MKYNYQPAFNKLLEGELDLYTANRLMQWFKSRGLTEIDLWRVSIKDKYDELYRILTDIMHLDYTGDKSVPYGPRDFRHAPEVTVNEVELKRLLNSGKHDIRGFLAKEIRNNAQVGTKIPGELAKRMSMSGLLLGGRLTKAAYRLNSET